jgi:hypothetical protein
LCKRLTTAMFSAPKAEIQGYPSTLDWAAGTCCRLCFAAQPSGWRDHPDNPAPWHGCLIKSFSPAYLACVPTPGNVCTPQRAMMWLWPPEIARHKNGVTRRNL